MYGTHTVLQECLSGVLLPHAPQQHGVSKVLGWRGMVRQQA